MPGMSGFVRHVPATLVLVATVGALYAGTPAAVSISVSPQSATLRGLDSVQFKAGVQNAKNKAVNWSVNGISGGNASVGTISSSGLYTGPATAVSPVTITATSQADTTKSAAAQITLKNPIPKLSAPTSALPVSTSASVTLNGSGFSNGCTVSVNGAAVPAIWISSSQVSVSIPVAPAVGGIVSFQLVNPEPGSASSNVVAANVQPGGSKLSYASAKHFLDQATWGATPADIAHLQAIGIDAWFAEQFDPNKTPASQYALPVDDTTGIASLQQQFYFNALQNPDQLRQRIAFALGQLTVVSGLKVQTYDKMMPYQQLLLNYAFTSYPQVLNDVTLSVAMGKYLDMVNNANLAKGASPNENYARELMQLFSIGLVQLQPNGMPIAGTAAPYTENDVRALARVLTGWQNPEGALTDPANWTLIANDKRHDTSTKQFLGTTITGSTAEIELGQALRAIEGYTPPGQHVPNVAPFVSLRLIQHFVTGNPAPDYVARISQVYVQTQGDLKAIVKAILTDPAAGQSNNPGRLREPTLMILALIRNLGGQAVSSDVGLSTNARSMGEDVFRSPTVFNFFTPLYTLPQTSAVAPEFQIHNESTGLSRLNFITRLAAGGGIANTTLNEGALVELASDNSSTQSASIGAMLNAVSEALLGQQPMASDLASIVKPAVLATGDPKQRVAAAIFLVASSGRFQIQH